MKNEIKGRVLVFSDVHQRVEWANRVLEVEKDVDHVVFLGDIFDTHLSGDQVSVLRTSAVWLKDLIHRPNTTVLMGNHDAPYREAYPWAAKGDRKRPLLTVCPGFTDKRAIEVAEIIKQEDWDKVGIFAYANGWLLSHAGACSTHWDKSLTTEENLANLYEEEAGSLANMGLLQYRMFDIGRCRGGDSPKGGPIWQDFDYEFADDFGLPQIVGHTNGPSVRKIGRSFCIDTHLGYAIIEKDGSLTHKRTMKSINGEWIDGTPKIVDFTEYPKGS